MDDGEDTAADLLGRIFAGIGKAERLFGAKAEAGNEAADHQNRHARGERAKDRENSEQQQVELINEPAAEPIAQLALSSGADEHAEYCGAADGCGFGGCRES